MSDLQIYLMVIWGVAASVAIFSAGMVFRLNRQEE